MFRLSVPPGEIWVHPSLCGPGWTARTNRISCGVEQDNPDGVLDDLRNAIHVNGEDPDSYTVIHGYLSTVFIEDEPGDYDA